MNQPPSPAVVVWHRPFHSGNMRSRCPATEAHRRGSRWDTYLTLLPAILSRMPLAPEHTASPGLTIPDYLIVSCMIDSAIPTPTPACSRVLRPEEYMEQATFPSWDAAACIGGRCDPPGHH